MSDRKRVAICLVNWKRPDDTAACVKSLLGLNCQLDVDIFICENKSPDDSFALIGKTLSNAMMEIAQGNSGTRIFEDRESSRRVFLLAAPQNLGFAGGNNFAIDHAVGLGGAGYDYYWLLNNDTEVPPNCLHEMLEKFRQPSRKVGICGSTMVYFHDKHTVQALGGSTYKSWSGTMREIGNGAHWPTAVDESLIEAQMTYVCGASMLVSADLIRDIGQMQTDYFLFFEEIDWCERARKAGYELAYASKAVVYHKEGAAIGTGVGAKRSLLAEYYGMRNKLLITWRFFPWFLPSVWLISWLQVLRRMLQKRPHNAWLMAKVLLGIGRRPV